MFSLHDSLGNFIHMIIITTSGFQRKESHVCISEETHSNRESAKMEQVLVFRCMQHDSFPDFIHLIRHKIPLYPGCRPCLSPACLLWHSLLTCYCVSFCLSLSLSQWKQQYHYRPWLWQCEDKPFRE